MSYDKYTTEGFVLGSWERGEHDKTLILYTRDFGRVIARATGIRKESSKQRYALQNYSRAQISLVRGKQSWRVAGAVCEHEAETLSLGAQKALARISRLITRLVHGEERNEYIFDTLIEARTSLSTAKDRTTIGVIELIAVARILHALGYLSDESLGSALFAHTVISTSELEEVTRVEKELLRSVNEALAESQL